jgi:hypothetical protein
MSRKITGAGQAAARIQLPMGMVAAGRAKAQASTRQQLSSPARSPYASMMSGFRQGEAKWLIVRSREAVEDEPILQKGLELISELANDSFRIQCESEDDQVFYDAWWSAIRGRQFIGDFLFNYLQDGVVFPLKIPVPFQVEGGNDASSSLMARSSAAHRSCASSMEAWGMAMSSASRQDVRGNLIEQLNGILPSNFAEREDLSIPGGYVLLEPLGMDVRGMKAFPWMRGLYSRIDDNLSSAIRSSPMDAPGVGMIPPEIVYQVKAGVMDIYLPQYLCKMVSTSTIASKPWGNPSTRSALRYVDQKRRLMDMDESTVNGIRNRILLVKVGSDEFPATQDDIQVVAGQLNTSDGNSTLIWHHCIDMKYVEPALDTLGQDKYSNCDTNIRTCIGVSQGLLGGDGGGALGNDTLNLKGMIEIIDKLQNVFCDWISPDLQAMDRMLGVKGRSKGVFGKLNLKDVNDYIRVLMSMVDRQIISYRTAAETLQYNFPKEVKRLKAEQKIRDEDGILVMTAAPSQQSSESQSASKPQAAQKTLGNGQQGRPAGVKEPNGRKSATKTPKGVKAVS